jgi:hypothetical protein
MKKGIILSILVLGFFSLHAENNLASYRVTGLFHPDQTDRLRRAISELEDIELVKVDYGRGELTVRFGKRFARDDSKQQLQSMSSQLRGATRGMFEFLPRVSTPFQDWNKIVIPIAGLDCKACAYAAYLSVNKLEGVARTTADFGKGRLSVWISPGKVTLGELESELIKRRVTMNYRIESSDLVPVHEMKVVRFSSEEARFDGHAKNLIDGDSQTIWQSSFADSVASPPHELILDLGRSRRISGFRYLARQNPEVVGQFSETEFYLSERSDSVEGKPAAKKTFLGLKSAQVANCPKPVSGRYLLVRVLSEINGKPNATAAEIGIVMAP